MGNPFEEGAPRPGAFVGREEELRTLDGHLDALGQGGQPTGVLISGIDGSGKTALAEECLRRAEKRELLTARLLVGPNLTAHQNMISLMELLVDRLDALPGRTGDVLADRLRRREGSADGRPPLLRVPSDSFLSHPSVEHDLRTIADEASKAGKHGVVIVLDEAQYADHELVGLLRHLARVDARYLFILTVRVASAPAGPTEAGYSWLVRTMSKPAGDPGMERFFGTLLGVGPFALAEAEDCIRRRLESASDGIGFRHDLISDICALGECVPGRIMRLSYYVYEACQRRRIAEAPPGMLTAAFRRTYPTIVEEALNRINQLSSGQRGVLERLMAHRSHPVRAAVLAQECFGDLSPDAEGAGATSLRALEVTMDAIARRCETLQHTDDAEYGIDGALNRAAVRLALNMSI